VSESGDDIDDDGDDDDEDDDEEEDEEEGEDADAREEGDGDDDDMGVPQRDGRKERSNAMPIKKNDRKRVNEDPAQAGVVGKRAVLGASDDRSSGDGG